LGLGRPNERQERKGGGIFQELKRGRTRGGRICRRRTDPLPGKHRLLPIFKPIGVKGLPREKIWRHGEKNASIEKFKKSNR